MLTEAASRSNMATPMFRCLSHRAGQIKLQLARWCLEQHAKNNLKYAIASPELLACGKANDKSIPSFSGSLYATNNVNKENRRYLSKVNDHDDRSRGGRKPKRPLRLMAFPELIWPHPLKSLKNMFFSFLIKGYYDDQFSPDSFLKGCEQAVDVVSDLISKGSFDELEGLVERDAILEIRNNYEELDLKQRNFIDVDPKDFFFRFIYEIGMIFDEKTDRRFVEITTIFQGFHGLNEIRSKNPESYAEEMQTAQEQIFVCNYRFIREYTKSKDEDSWMINKLNHFSPKELVMNSDIFRR